MTPREEKRQKCKSDYFALSRLLGYDFHETEDVHREFFKLLPVPDSTKPIRDLSDVKNRLILWPRGHFKTSAMVLYIVMLILNFPDIRILLMQGNLKLTKIWLTEIKSHFEPGKNPKSKLLDLFPEFAADDNKPCNASEFTTSARVRKHLAAATVAAASPKAISTGQHCDIFFADDLVHANNYRNVELLDKLETEFSHFVPLIDPGGYTIVTGTRYTFADIYGRIIRRNQGEWVISVKGVYDGPGGRLIFPERITSDGRKIGFTPEILAVLQRDDPETFNAQYLNRIIPTKSHLFPEQLLLSRVRSTKEDDFPKDAPSAMTVDLATGKHVDSDHSVVAAGRMGKGKIWVTDCVGSTYSPSALVMVIMQMALRLRPTVILVERMTGAEFFVEYAKTVAREKGVNLPIVLNQLSQKKDAKYIRVAAMERHFKNGTLVLAAGITDFERLVEEFTQFPKGRHDDRPDAISMLVDYFMQGFVPQRTSNLPWVVTDPGVRLEAFESKQASPTCGDDFCN